MLVPKARRFQCSGGMIEIRCNHQFLFGRHGLVNALLFGMHSRLRYRLFFEVINDALDRGFEIVLWLESDELSDLPDIRASSLDKICTLSRFCG